jgi:hypothetical protein
LGIAHRGRQADPLDVSSGNPANPRENRQQVPATVIASKGMKFVNDGQLRHDHILFERLFRFGHALGQVEDEIAPTDPVSTADVAILRTSFDTSPNCSPSSAGRASQIRCRSARMTASSLLALAEHSLNHAAASLPLHEQGLKP